MSTTTRVASPPLPQAPQVSPVVRQAVPPPAQPARKRRDTLLSIVVIAIAVPLLVALLIAFNLFSGALKEKAEEGTLEAHVADEAERALDKIFEGLP